MYACESGHKNYLVYTDHSKDENGSEMQFASVFDPTDEEPALYPIQSDDDWQIIDLMLSPTPWSLRRQPRRKRPGQTEIRRRRRISPPCIFYIHLLFFSSVQISATGRKVTKAGSTVRMVL